MSGGPLRFGNYLLQQRVGVSQLTEDFLAVDTGGTGGGTQVVVRQMLPALCARPEVVEAFSRGALGASLVPHRNLARVISVGEIDERPFLVQQHHPGRTLRQVLTRLGKRGAPKLPSQLATCVTHQAMLGLQHVYRQQQPSDAKLDCSHRDLSPEHLLIGFDGSVRLTGLGLSEAGDLAPDSGASLSETWGRQPPERAWGRGGDAAVDVFAMGMTLYEMLHGHLPPARNTALEALAREVGEHRRARVTRYDLLECPKCGEKTGRLDAWPCTPGCGARWQSFDTRGRCPKCGKQWQETTCLKCHQKSPHDAWYRPGWEPTHPTPLSEALREKLFAALSSEVRFESAGWSSLGSEEGTPSGLETVLRQAVATDPRQRPVGPSDLRLMLEASTDDPGSLSSEATGENGLEGQYSLRAAMGSLMGQLFPEAQGKPELGEDSSPTAPGLLTPALGEDSPSEQILHRRVQSHSPTVLSPPMQAAISHTRSWDPLNVPSEPVPPRPPVAAVAQSRTQAPPQPDAGPSTDPAVDAPPGSEEFGRYRLVKRLGKGGMAQTWKAMLVGAAGVSKPVVIKRILPQHASNERFVREFIDEARITATLSHGNVAQVFDFGQVKGEYFLAMEFVHGRTLEAVLDAATDRGFVTLPVPVATFITIEMLKGLHYAHTRTREDGRPLGIVHRDVSPDNVLIGFDGQTKIVDFGVAKARISGRLDTAPGLVKGKWSYFSPEQAAGEPVDGRSDVFTTGVVLYRMLCSRVPFLGPAKVALRALVDGDYPSPASLNPTLPPALVGIVQRALEGSLSRRFRDAGKMEEELRAFLGKTAPEFSSTTLSHFVRWLFEAELADEGLDVGVPTSARRQFEDWQQQSRAALGAAVDRLTTRKVRPGAVQRLASTLGRNAVLAGGALLFGATLGALVWFLFRR